MINRKEFDAADVSGKIALFEAALDAGALDANEAFDLLSTIHAELNARQGHGRATYTRYAALIEKLEHQAPDLYRKVSAAYAQSQPPAPQPLVYSFKAVYRRDPAIWLTVELLASQTLHHLHGAIRDAFRLGHGHPYSFFLSGRAGDTASEYAARPAPGARNVHDASLERLPLQPGHHFLYRFEPDDESQFAVQLIGLNPPAPSGRYPRIVEKHGELALHEAEIEAKAEEEEEGEEREEKEEAEGKEEAEAEGEELEGEEKEEGEAQESEGKEKEEAEGEEKEEEKTEEAEGEEKEEAEEKEEVEHEEAEGEGKEEAEDEKPEEAEKPEVELEEEHEGPEGEEPEEEHEAPEGEEHEEEHEAPEGEEHEAEEHEAAEGEGHEAPEGEGEHGGEEHAALEGEGEPVAEPDSEPSAEAEAHQAESQAIAGEGEGGESTDAMLSGAGEEVAGGEAEAGSEAAGD